MSCGQIALKELGIVVKTYYSCEIDKNAIKVTMDNFPNTIQLGDVTKISEDFLQTLPKVDLVIFGSPCRSLSKATAGRKEYNNGLQGTSWLFYPCNDILQWIKTNNNPDVMFKFTDEQWEYLRKAKQISREKYSNIQFIKMFDNDMNKVKRIIKKLAKLGYQTIMFDTMKSEDEIDEAMWQQLLIHSRKLFQITSRENISLICTYQLALHTLNKRYLDASCLSNAKQIKEVFSEMVYCRPLWDDEFPGEKFDVKPYQLKKDSSGKYSNVRESVQLDRDKKYIIAFLDKTRNDDDKIQVLYEFNGRYNRWREKGYCSVFNEHK